MAAAEAARKRAEDEAAALKAAALKVKLECCILVRDGIRLENCAGMRKLTLTLMGDQMAVAEAARKRAVEQVAAKVIPAILSVS